MYKKRHNSVSNAFKPFINPHPQWMLDEKSYASPERVLKVYDGSNLSVLSCRNKKLMSLTDLSISNEKLIDRSKDEYIRDKATS